MSTEHEPTRWSESGGGADPELAKLLGMARDDGLMPQEIDALARSFSSPPASPGPGRLLKIGGLGTGGALAIIAALVWLAPDKPALLEKSKLRELPRVASAAPAQPKPSAVLDLDETSAEKPPTPSASAAAPEVQEFQLLRAARAALPTDPARALALAKTHEKKFPNGVLKQEREVIVISALKKLGRTNDADQRADEFKKSHPDSAHNPKFDPEKAP
jgi:hypothetical protein